MYDPLMPDAVALLRGRLHRREAWARFGLALFSVSFWIAVGYAAWCVL